MVCALCGDTPTQKDPGDCFSNLLKQLEAHYKG